MKLPVEIPLFKIIQYGQTTKSLRCNGLQIFGSLTSTHAFPYTESHGNLMGCGESSG